MNIHVRRRNDTFNHIIAYRQQYPSDFPTGSIEALQVDELEIVVGLIGQHGADQLGKFGDVRFGFNSKGISRENLREEVDDIGTIARTMVYEFPGIDLKFNVPGNLPDAAMLALAKAFHTRFPEYNAGFKRYGLDGSVVLPRLQTKIDAFEASLAPPEMALDAQVEATAQLGEAVRRGMIAWRILRGVMKVKYKNNPAKYQAWLSASRIEKDSPDDDKGENDGESGDNQTGA
jgi:hypothetical protein